MAAGQIQSVVVEKLAGRRDRTMDAPGTEGLGADVLAARKSSQPEGNAVEGLDDYVVERSLRHRLCSTTFGVDFR
jgi:hypothetical protein